MSKTIYIRLWKKNNRIQYLKSEIIVCLNGMYEALHTQEVKKDTKRPNSSLDHPVGQQKEWSEEPHSGFN